MYKIKKLNQFILAAFLCVLTGKIIADDIMPPEWRYGDQDGKTFQAWEYLTPDIPALPTVSSNVYGVATNMFISFYVHWTNGVTGPVGIPVSGWATPIMGGEFIFEIENRPEPLEQKLIWLQITSTKVPGNITGSPELTNVVNIANIQRPQSPWYTYVYSAQIIPNPNHETINISFPVDTIVDEVVIDTWCLPEPMFMTVLLSILLFTKIRR